MNNLSIISPRDRIYKVSNSMNVITRAGAIELGIDAQNYTALIEARKGTNFCIVICKWLSEFHQVQEIPYEILLSSGISVTAVNSESTIQFSDTCDEIRIVYLISE